MPAYSQSDIEAAVGQAVVILDNASAHVPGTLELVCPLTVTPRQLQLALIDLDIGPDDIPRELAKISDTKSRRKAVAEWGRASEIHRAHPLIGQVGAVFSLDTAALNALFRAAAQL